MTERTVARQSRLEDDAISITSTQASEHPEDFEFTVDRILAERTADRKKYLIRWLNYPVERSTWEPRKNILDPAIVDLWKKRKMRETSGIDPPFNLAGFNDQLNKLAEEKAQRHRQRKAKRRRLGLPVSPSNSDQSDDNDSSVDAMKVTGDEVQSVDGSPSGIDANLRVRRDKERQEDSTAGASVELARPVLGKFQEKANHVRPAFQSSPYVPLASTPLEEQEQRVESPSADNPFGEQRLPPRMVLEPAPKQNVLVRDLLELGVSASTRGNPSARDASADRIEGATRAGSSLASKNVFTTGDLLDVSANPTQSQKAELQGRDIANAAPDLEALEALPGGLVDPSKPFTSQPIRATDFRRASSNKLPQEESDIGGLFVDPDERLETKRAQEMSSTTVTNQGPPTQAPMQQHPNPSRTVCFYWNRGQQDPSKGSCSKGFLCGFIHEYEAVPVAPSPAGDVEKTDRRASLDKTSLQDDLPRNDTSLALSSRRLWENGERATCYSWDRGFHTHMSLDSKLLARQRVM
ncbi:hypothetical protein IFR05_016329 [Cadophora sp. M221]|nr:hypothetical protein IFR05_016329 [Cadophora sp. M221]